VFHGVTNLDLLHHETRLKEKIFSLFLFAFFLFFSRIHLQSNENGDKKIIEPQLTNENEKNEEKKERLESPLQKYIHLLIIFVNLFL